MADIDFGQLSEALNDKTDRDLRNVDTTAKADAVIDYQEPTADNGYTWYRKYKSGWVEQGVMGVGLATSIYTFTFLIPMASNKYEVMTSIRDALNTQHMTAKYNSQTTTSVQVRSSYQSSQIYGDIRVSGIAAS